MSTEGCPDYDPVYSAGGVMGGPCWTCRDDPYMCAYSGYVVEDPFEGESTFGDGR